MRDSSTFTARGFGPGLPSAGAPVSLRIAGDRLTIDGWPAISEVQKAALAARPQGDGLLLEWPTHDGKCALLIDKVGAGETAAWLPETPVRHDAATRSWLWAALLFLIGLPLLLLGFFFGFRAQIVDAAVARIPVAQEQALADQLWKLQRAQLKLIEGGAANKAIEEIGARLAAAAPTPYTYRFHLADDQSVNAFAIPAGYIVVHRGLIAQAGSAEEVAGVLAHEIQHVESRHGLRGMVQTTGLSVVWLAVTGDLGGGLAGDWIKDLATMQFSREQEIAADNGGYARLLKAGIDPRGMARFFDTLGKQRGSLPATLSLLSTHPASSERSARLQQLMRDTPALPPLAYDWARLQASLK